MSDMEGTLRMMASGRWAVCRRGQEPVASGELFRVEVDGASDLLVTRMESSIVPTRHGFWRAVYYSVDGYPLRDGLRAAIGEQG
jgi:hypothetical protein